MILTESQITTLRDLRQETDVECDLDVALASTDGALAVSVLNMDGKPVESGRIDSEGHADGGLRDILRGDSEVSV